MIKNFKLETYKSAIEGEIFTHVKKLYGHDYTEIISSLPYVKLLCEIFRVKPTTVIKLIQKHKILLDELLEFTTYETPYLVFKNGVYTEKWKPGQGMVHTSYNVYLKESEYITVYFKDIHYDLFKMKFPELCEGVFSKEENIFKSNDISINLNGRMDSIKRFINDNATLPLKELKRILNKPENLKNTKTSTVFEIYSFSENCTMVYYPLNGLDNLYHRSIPINITDLFNRDWKSFCDHVKGLLKMSQIFEEQKNNPDLIHLKEWFMNGKKK